MEKEKIQDYLKRCGIREKNKAFTYLTDAISICMEKGPYFQMMNLCKEVAKLHDTTVNSVERAIRYELGTVGIDSCNKDFILFSLYYLGDNADNEREDIDCSEHHITLHDLISELQKIESEVGNAEICSIGTIRGEIHGVKNPYVLHFIDGSRRYVSQKN